MAGPPQDPEASGVQARIVPAGGLSLLKWQRVSSAV